MGPCGSGRTFLQPDVYCHFSSGVIADYRLPSDFVNGDTAIIWFMVCCLSHAQTAELAKPIFARQPVQS